MSARRNVVRCGFRTNEASAAGVSCTDGVGTTDGVCAAGVCTGSAFGAAGVDLIAKRFRRSASSRAEIVALAGVQDRAG